MKVVAISQRVDIIKDHQEHRDGLDQNLIRFLFACGFLAVPVPNILNESSKGDSSVQYLMSFLNKINPNAFILSGGPDIGENIERDKIEIAIINYAEQKELPLLGICRGMQIMASRKGITLKPLVGHVGTRHKVKGEICRTVNSYHNLCISDCPDGYMVISRSEENSIEAIKHLKLPWEGWMWHPEREPQFANQDIERVKSLFNF